MDIYDMKLHDQKGMPECEVDILRVPGGWIYQFYDNCDSPIISTTFVPYSEEFAPVKQVSGPQISLTSKAKEREQEGAHAYRLGKPTSDCPFPGHTSDRILWLFGWGEAERKAKRDLQKTEEPDQGENEV